MLALAIVYCLAGLRHFPELRCVFRCIHIRSSFLVAALMGCWFLEGRWCFCNRWPFLSRDPVARRGKQSCVETSRSGI